MVHVAIIDKDNRLQHVMDVINENVMNVTSPSTMKLIFSDHEFLIDARFDKGEHLWDEKNEVFYVDPDVYSKWAEEFPEEAANDETIMVDAFTGLPVEKG